MGSMLPYIAYMDPMGNKTHGHLLPPPKKKQNLLAILSNPIERRRFCPTESSDLHDVFSCPDNILNLWFLHLNKKVRSWLRPKCLEGSKDTQMSGHGEPLGYSPKEFHHGSINFTKSLEGSKDTPIKACRFHGEIRWFPALQVFFPTSARTRPLHAAAASAAPAAPAAPELLRMGKGPLGILGKICTMWGPQDMFVGLAKAPVTIVMNTINHSYWSYVHQLSYRTGASHCRDKEKTWETWSMLYDFMELYGEKENDMPRIWW